MPLEPLNRMIRMIPMPTSDAKAQKLTHSTLYLRQLPLARPLLRIMSPEPKSADSAARHMTTTFWTHSASVCRRPFGLCLTRSPAVLGFVLAAAAAQEAVVVLSERSQAVRALESHLRRDPCDFGGAFARAGQAVVMGCEFGSFIEGAPRLHLLEVNFAPHFPTDIVDVEGVCEAGG